MKRKFILKFDIKNGNIRCDMYQAESIRIQGRAETILLDDITKGAVHHSLNYLLMKLDDEFDIGFKKNSINNIKTWIRWH